MKLAVILALPLICLLAAWLVGTRVFRRTGSAPVALRRHLLTVMLAAVLCVAFTVVATAVEGDPVDAEGEDISATDVVEDDVVATEDDVVAEDDVMTTGALSESEQTAQYVAAADAVGSATGMGFIAAALAIGLSAIGAGIALAAGAPAAIGAVSEDPKAFGKAMIFVVLGEAVALYGLVVAMLIIFLKIPTLPTL